MRRLNYYIGGDRQHSLWASAQKWRSDSWQMYDQQAAPELFVGSGPDGSPSQMVRLTVGKMF